MITEEPQELAERIHAFFALFLSPGTVDVAVEEHNRSVKLFGIDSPADTLANACEVLARHVVVTDDNLAISLYEEAGLSVPEVADVVGLTFNEVEGYLREEGLLPDPVEPNPVEPEPVEPEPVEPEADPVEPGATELPAADLPTDVDSDAVALADSAAIAALDDDLDDVDDVAVSIDEDSSPSSAEPAVAKGPLWPAPPAASTDTEEPAIPALLPSDSDDASAKPSASASATPRVAAPVAKTTSAPAVQATPAQTTPAASPKADSPGAYWSKSNSARWNVPPALIIGLVAAVVVLGFIAIVPRGQSASAGCAVAAIEVQDAMITGEVDRQGNPGAARDVFTRGEVVKLWFRYERNTAEPVKLNMAWSRGTVTAFTAPFSLPLVGTVVNLSLADTYQDQAGEYRVVVRDGDCILVDEAFTITEPIGGTDTDAPAEEAPAGELSEEPADPNLFDG